MQNIIAYIKNPRYIKKQKFEPKVFGKTLLLDFLAIFTVLPILAILYYTFGVERAFEHEEGKMLFLAVIVAPVTEEIIFRLYLRPTRNNLLVYFIGLLLFVISALVGQKTVTSIVLLAILGIFLLFYYLIRDREIRFSRWYIRNFKWVFYFSCLLFGLVHVTNYKYDGLHSLFVLPIMVLPQIISGGLLGFIRMKYGLRYSMLLHACNNLIACSFLLL